VRIICRQAAEWAVATAGGVPDFGRLFVEETGFILRSSSRF
jgi:hypothetical protein